MTEQAQKQPFWLTLGLPAPGAHIRLEEYTALPEVNFHVEWHEGVVIYPNWNEETMSPAPSLQHQRVVMHVIKVLLAQIPDGDVFTAPTDVWLSGKVVQPDVFWVAETSPCIPQEQYFVGGPDLVVEVLSLHNTENDRVTKFDLYEQNGVREYWIANPHEVYIEVYTLEGTTFRRLGAFKSGSSFSSPVLGSSISVKALFTG